MQHAHHLLLIDRKRVVTTVEEYVVSNFLVPLLGVTNDLIRRRIISIRRENELPSEQIIRVPEGSELFGGDVSRLDCRLGGRRLAIVYRRGSSRVYRQPVNRR